MSIQINVSVEDTIMFVNLAGELDQSTTEQVKFKLTTSLAVHEVKHILFNLKALTFMDSSGIGLILGRYNQIKALGGKVFVLGMNETVKKVFHLAGLNQILTVIDDEQEMVRTLEEAI